MYSLSPSQAAALRNAHFIAEDPASHDYDHIGMCTDVLELSSYIAELCEHVHTDVAPSTVQAVTLATVLQQSRSWWSVQHQTLKQTLATLGTEARRLRLLS